MVKNQISHRVFIYAFHCILYGCALSALTFCNKQKQNRPADQLKEVTVGITTSFLGEAATFTAKEKGFFRDQGLNITFKNNPSGEVSIKDLFRGDIDIAHVAETPVVYSLVDTSYYKETEVPPFQIFADMIYSHEIQKIIARRDHGIERPRDIAEKKVGILRGTQLDYFLDSFLLEYQIPQKSLSLVNLDPKNQVEAITQGNIDVSVTWEPYATYIQQQLKTNSIELDTKLTYSTLWMAATLDSYAEAHPEILVAYLNAINQAQNYLKAHPEESQKLLASKTGVPISVVKSTWDEITYELSISERLITLLEDQARWMKLNDIADTTEYNFKNLINTMPMQKVYPKGITIIE